MVFEKYFAGLLKESRLRKYKCAYFFFVDRIMIFCLSLLECKL